MKLLPGYKIKGRYSIIKQIGYGGMAVVYKAYDEQLSRPVAIKVMRYDFADDSGFQKRFSREIRAASILKHRNIVALYDIGKLDKDGFVIPYLVMEHLDGVTLREYLKRHRLLNLNFVLYVIEKILLALEYSHNSMIIHRDIKPANIMITTNKAIKLMDFGIAAPIADSTSRLTKSSMVLGTVHYIPPENIVSKETSSLGDIYSVGCLFYELLVFRVPFTGSAPVAVAYKHINTVPIPPSRLNKRLPKAIDDIVLKSLAKKVDERYQSALEMREAISKAKESFTSNIFYSDNSILNNPEEDDMEKETKPALESPATKQANELVKKKRTQADKSLSQKELSHEPQLKKEQEENNNDKRVLIGHAAHKKKRRPLFYIILLLIALLLGFTAYTFASIFTTPSNQYTIVPDLFGEKVDSETVDRVLKRNHLKKGSLVPVNNDNVSKGRIVSSIPNFKRKVKSGTLIKLYYSTGSSFDKSDGVIMPYILGMSVPNALDVLKDKGVDIENNVTLSFAQGSDFQSGKVVATTPNSKENFKHDTKITLSISNHFDNNQYNATKLVPNLIGMKLSDAINILVANGFRFKLINAVLAQSYNKRIVAQQPDSNILINRTSQTIELRVE